MTVCAVSVWHLGYFSLGELYDRYHTLDQDSKSNIINVINGKFYAKF
jgi:hypothetical protein